MTIKGMIWYQGEGDRNTPGSYVEKRGYACHFPLMISDYRKKWAERSGTEPQFPFGFVQLSGYCQTNDHRCVNVYNTLPAIRRAQTADYGYVPNPAMENVFMAVSVDLPDSLDPPGPPNGDIHPRDKKDVGIRLANGALNLVYKQNVPYSGPLFRNCSYSGNNLTLSFDETLLGSDTINVKVKTGIEVLNENNVYILNII